MASRSSRAQGRRRGHEIGEVTGLTTIRDSVEVSP